MVYCLLASRMRDYLLAPITERSFATRPRSLDNSTFVQWYMATLYAVYDLPLHKRNRNESPQPPTWSRCVLRVIRVFVTGSWRPMNSRTKRNCCLRIRSDLLRSDFVSSNVKSLPSTSVKFLTFLSYVYFSHDSLYILFFLFYFYILSISFVSQVRWKFDFSLEID